jgi:hypothetical protein
MASAMFSIRQPKDPKSFSCCWNSIIRFICGRDAGGRSAGHQPAAALERQHGARPGVGADMFEDDIDAALLGQLADDALETVFAVVDHVIGAKSLGRLDLGVRPTVVMTVQPIFLASWIAAVPMPEPPAWIRMVSPGSSLALSNSMCSTVPKVTGATAAPMALTPGGAGTRSRPAD